MKIFKQYLTVLLLVLLSGCATVSSKYMVPQEIHKSSISYDESIVVEVIDSNNNGWLRSVELPNKFKIALTETIKRLGLFNPVNGSNDGGSYRLKVNIIDYGSRRGDFAAFTHVMNARYILLDSHATAIFDETYVSACEKTMSDYGVGATRVVKASECAVQDNIIQFMNEFSKNIQNNAKH